jgi:hypothetical protein
MALSLSVQRPLKAGAARFPNITGEGGREAMRETSWEAYNKRVCSGGWDKPYDVIACRVLIDGAVWTLGSQPDAPPHSHAKYQTAKQCRECGQIIHREKVRYQHLVLLLLECHCISINRPIDQWESASAAIRSVLTRWDKLVPWWLKLAQEKQFSDELIRLPDGWDTERYDTE